MKDFNDDDHLDVCQNIEAGIKLQYEYHPSLTDSLCIGALDNAKIAIKQQFGNAKNEKVKATEETQGIIDWCRAKASYVRLFRNCNSLDRFPLKTNPEAFTYV